jgi:hypothetical protein
MKLDVKVLAGAVGALSVIVGGGWSAAVFAVDRLDQFVVSVIEREKRAEDLRTEIRNLESLLEKAENDEVIEGLTESLESKREALGRVD